MTDSFPSLSEANGDPDVAGLSEKIQRIIDKMMAPIETGKSFEEDFLIVTRRMAKAVQQLHEVQQGLDRLRQHRRDSLH